MVDGSVPRVDGRGWKGLLDSLPGRRLRWPYCQSVLRGPG